MYLSNSVNFMYSQNLCKSICLYILNAKKSSLYTCVVMYIINIYTRAYEIKYNHRNESNYIFYFQNNLTAMQKTHTFFVQK